MRAEPRHALTFEIFAGLSGTQPVHNPYTMRMYDFVGGGVKVLVGEVVFAGSDTVAVATVRGDRTPYIRYRQT